MPLGIRVIFAVDRRAQITISTVTMIVTNIELVNHGILGNRGLAVTVSSSAASRYVGSIGISPYRHKDTSPAINRRSKPPEGLEGERPIQATHIATCKSICEIFHKVARTVWNFGVLGFAFWVSVPGGWINMATQNPKLKTPYSLRSPTRSRIGSEWSGSWAISSSDSRHLLRRFVPANSPNSTNKRLCPRSFPSGALPKTGRRTFHLEIFSSISFP